MIKDPFFRIVNIWSLHVPVYAKFIPLTYESSCSSWFKTHPPEPEASSASRPTSVLHLSLSRPHALAIKFTLQSASSIIKKKKGKKETRRIRGGRRRGKKGIRNFEREKKEPIHDCNHSFPERESRLKKGFLRGLFIQLQFSKCIWKLILEIKGRRLEFF